jgi:hypothetical protein
MVSEFVDLSKQYVREQTLDPAKQLGKLAGFGCAAAAVLALAVLFLSIAGMRLIVELLPDGVLWSGLGYVLSAMALFVITGIVMWRASR